MRQPPAGVNGAIPSGPARRTASIEVPQAADGRRALASTAGTWAIDNLRRPNDVILALCPTMAALSERGYIRGRAEI